MKFSAKNPRLRKAAKRCLQLDHTLLMSEATNYIPKTELELEAWMKANCFNFQSYSINGNAIFEGYGIDRFGSLFIWYYTERGERNTLKYFQTEEEIVEYVFTELQNDKWAKAHCIGFTTNKNEAVELSEKLNSLTIDFFQDEIPYYGLNNPVFRTFVLGCDWKRVNDLKQKYYKAPS